LRNMNERLQLKSERVQCEKNELKEQLKSNYNLDEILNYLENETTGTATQLQINN